MISWRTSGSVDELSELGAVIGNTIRRFVDVDLNIENNVFVKSAPMYGVLQAGGHQVRRPVCGAVR